MSMIWIWIRMVLYSGPSNWPNSSFVMFLKMRLICAACYLDQAERWTGGRVNQTTGSAIEIMLKDEYANYVVQTMLDVRCVSDILRLELLQQIEPHLPSILSRSVNDWALKLSNWKYRGKCRKLLLCRSHWSCASRIITKRLRTRGRRSIKCSLQAIRQTNRDQGGKGPRRAHTLDGAACC